MTHYTVVLYLRRRGRIACDTCSPDEARDSFSRLSAHASRAGETLYIELRSDGATIDDAEFVEGVRVQGE